MKQYPGTQTLKLPSSAVFLVLPLLLSFSSTQIHAEEARRDRGIKNQFDEAVEAGEKAKKANLISIGLWTGSAALCGYNCFNYLVTLDSAKKEILAATKGLNTALAPISPCPAAAGQVTAAQSGLATLDALIAATEGDKAVAAAETATIKSGGQAIKDAKEEGIEASLKPIHAQLAGIPLAVNGYVTSTCSASVVTLGTTAAACTPCLAAQGALATLSTAYSSFQTAEAHYTAALQSVRTFGLACTIGGVGVGIADFGISQAFGQELTQGLMGAAGALPPAIYLMKDILTKQTPVGSASSLGVGSCLTAAGALLEVAVKTFNVKSTNDSIRENKENSEKFNSGQQGAQNWLEILDGVIPEAAAAENSVFSSFPACGYKEKTASAVLSCGLQADSTLARALGAAQNQNRFFGAIEKAFGRDGITMNDFITETPMPMEKVITLMTKDKPELAPKVMQLYQRTEQEVRRVAAAGGLTVTGIPAKAGLRSVPVEASAGSLPPVFSVAEPKKSGISENEGLFETLSRRFRGWKNRFNSR
jgi:hypothetical protein